MTVTIEKSIARGSISAPPSKSMAHRLLICAGLAEGESVISNVALSQDVLATLDCLAALGARVEINGGTVRVVGTDVSEFDGEAPLDCRECGSTLRFVIPLCLIGGRGATLRGSETLLSRPLSVYEEIAQKQGLIFDKSDRLFVGGKLQPGEFTVAGNISSQFISGLLFALPLLGGESTLRIIPPLESRPYLEMTLYALGMFGINIIRQDALTFIIPGGQTYRPANAAVEGDESNAAFLGALDILGGEVEVTGLNPTSLQGDRVWREAFKNIQNGFCEMDITDCPDLAPILFAVASARDGAHFTGTKRLRWKECDRAQAMAQELAKLGAQVEIGENDVTVYGGRLHAPEENLSGHNDHRVVMALAAVLTLTGGSICGAQAVRKSYPDFFSDIQRLGVRVQYDGMD